MTNSSQQCSPRRSSPMCRQLSNISHGCLSLHRDDSPCQYPRIRLLQRAPRRPWSLQRSQRTLCRPLQHCLQRDFPTPGQRRLRKHPKIFQRNDSRQSKRHLRSSERVLTPPTTMPPLQQPPRQHCRHRLRPPLHHHSSQDSRASTAAETISRGTAPASRNTKYTDLGTTARNAHPAERVTDTHTNATITRNADAAAVNGRETRSCYGRG